LILRRLLHISDIHFGPPHRGEVAEGVLALIASRSPDLVVISGDLTQRAKGEQFRDARRFVDRIQVPSLAVPGNHDVPMYRVWERLFDPFGAYCRYFCGQMEPVYEAEGLVVVGVNSAFNWTVKDGRITRARLEQVEARLAAAPATATRVVVAHHPLVPAPRFDTQRVATHAYETVQMLTRAKVDLLLSGHLHQAYIAPSDTYYPVAGGRTLLVQSGTTTSSRGRGCERGKNTCNWIEISGQEIAITHLLWEGEKAAFLAASRHVYPRQGLHLGNAAIS
jgi:3',5'-cyclic AMP phosphodiesterase CpdA